MSEKDKGEKRFETDEDLTKVEIPELLPVLPLRGIVIFPSQIHPFLVSRAASLKLIEDVGGASAIIALAAQKNPEEETPGPEGLYPRGTAVRILKMLKYPDQSVRVLVQGLARIEMRRASCSASRTLRPMSRGSKKPSCRIARRDALAGQPGQPVLQIRLAGALSAR